MPDNIKWIDGRLEDAMKTSTSEDVHLRDQMELLQSLEPEVTKHLSLLTPVEKAWQPTDFLPDLNSEDWHDCLKRFREPAQNISDELLVVLVGNMVTEEALPNYSILLNLIARDCAGASNTGWARWMRGWTAEENRHGDLLNAYLRLTGRVNMRSVELTVHHLIGSGFDPRSYPDPYAGLIYPSFQERATKLSHGKVSRLASNAGDANLSRICATVAGDEGRHEQFYTRIMGEVMDRDPEQGILVFRQMMRRVIAMPGKLMFDGQDRSLFDHFAIVAQRIGVYTVSDYAQIIRHLVQTWDIAHRSVTGKAASAQEFLCAQAERLETLADSIAADIASQPQVKFNWIHDRMA